VILARMWKSKKENIKKFMCLLATTNFESDSAGGHPSEVFTPRAKTLELPSRTKNIVCELRVLNLAL